MKDQSRKMNIHYRQMLIMCIAICLTVFAVIQVRGETESPSFQDGIGLYYQNDEDYGCELWTVTSSDAIHGYVESYEDWGDMVSTTGTIQLTNNSGAEMILELSYDARDAASLVIGGTEMADHTGVYQDEEFQVGETLEIQVSSQVVGKLSADLYLTGIRLISKETMTVTFLPDPYGMATYQVGDISIAPQDNGYTVENLAPLSELAYTFESSTSSNRAYYVLAAWHWYEYDGEDLVADGYVSVGQTPIRVGDSSTLTISGNYKLEPVFAYFAGEKAPLRAGGEYWWTWETAFSAAAASGNKTVVQTANYTLPGNMGQNGMTKNGTYVTFVNSKPVFHIPEGFTFLAPRAAGCEVITDEEVALGTLPHANYGTWKDEAVYYMSNNLNRNMLLTVHSGITIQNEGRLILGGTIAANDSYFNGSTLSDYNHGDNTTHSDLYLAGTLVMGDNSVLSAIGYITGNGTVKAEGQGAEIYQPFVVCDYRGGNYVLGASFDPEIYTDYPYAFGVFLEGGERVVAPFMRYTMQNIQTQIVMKAGNYMYGYTDMFAQGNHNMDTPLIIGDGEKNGLLNLADGATLTADYTGENKVTHYDAFVNGKPWNGTTGDGSCGTYSGWGYDQVGRTNLTVDGGASFGSLQLTVTTGGRIITLDMSNYTFPIPYNFNITLTDGNYEIANPMMLLPGATMIVGEDAKLNIGNAEGAEQRFMVMDGLFDHTMNGQKNTQTTSYRYTTDYTYPKTSDLQSAGLSGTAELILDGGELEVNSGVKFGGLVQTTGAADSKVTFNALNSCDVRVGLVGGPNYNMNYSWAGATVRTLDAKLLGTDGEPITIETGKTYTGMVGESTITSYSYELYTSYTQKAVESHTDTAEGACDNCKTCQLYYDNPYTGVAEDPRCVCNVYDPIAVKGAWFDYDHTITVVDGDLETVYYVSGYNIFNAQGEIVEAKYSSGEEICGVTTNTNDPEYFTTQKINENEVTFGFSVLSSDVVVTVTHHIPGESASCTGPQICTECSAELGPGLDHDFRYNEGVKETVYYENDLITWTYTCSNCGATGDVLEGNVTVQELPDDITPETNLWNLLNDESYIFYGTSGNGVWQNTANGSKTYSVTFPVSEGDQIYATSFQSKGANGNSNRDGSFVTFIMEDGSIKAYSRFGVVREFNELGYITVPQDVKYINIHMWSDSEDNELYLLTAGDNAVEEIEIPATMYYDDRIDCSGHTVSISNPGTPTSTKVGYGVAENTPDDAVITLVDGKLIATGIGTAEVIVNGVAYEIEVKPAPISMLLLIGQSNMAGSDGDAGQSIACEDGQVYSTYRTTSTATAAETYAPSALTGDSSLVNIDGGAITGHPLNSLTESGDGKKGMDSALAYEWIKQTGEKVWVINAAQGSTQMKSWAKGASQYKYAVAIFKACQETMQKEIEAGHYTLSHMGYFWCQGCSDTTMTASEYVEKYLSMHEGLKTDLVFDHDSSSETADLTMEFGSIILVRAGAKNDVGYRDGTRVPTTADYWASFQDLRMTGPRVAQLWMGNNPELADIWNVCMISEDWVTMPDGEDGVAEYFASRYEGGRVDYPTQTLQTEEWRTPETSMDVHPTVHYVQVGYNELGMEAARNTLYNLGELTPPENEEAEVKFLSWDGYTEVTSVAADASASDRLVVPVVSPVYMSKTVTYDIAAGVDYTYYDVTVNNALSLEGITAVGAQGSVTVVPAEITSVTLKEHVQYPADDVCCGTNLWEVLTPEQGYFTSAGAWTTNPMYKHTIWSVTIPVVPGERVYASSLGEKGTNGFTGSDVEKGAMISFHTASGKSYRWGISAAGELFEKYKGYIIVPEEYKTGGGEAPAYMTITMWSRNPDGGTWEIYMLDREHNVGDSEIDTQPTFDTAGTASVVCRTCDAAIESSELYSAQIGKTQYQTVKEALADAKHMETISLRTTISGNIPVSQEVTFALGENSEEQIVPGTGFTKIVNGDGTVAVTADAVVLDALSLDIEGEIQLNFKFYVPEGFIGEGSFRVTEEGNAVVGVDPQVRTISLGELTRDSKGRYEVSCGIAAGEMTGDVMVEFLEGGESQVIYSKQEIEGVMAITRTVQDYAKLAFENGSQELRDLSAAMLVFGGYAQNFYGTHTGKLASSILPDYGFTTPDLNNFDVALPSATHSGENIGIAVNAQQVDLDSNVKLRVYFELEEGYAIDSYTFQIEKSIGNGTARTTYVPDVYAKEVVSDGNSKTLYCVEIDTPPAYWNDDYVITITNSSGAYTVTTSVMTWVKSCLSSGTATEAEMNMAKAMYYYCVSADAYFASKAEQ